MNYLSSIRNGVFLSLLLAILAIGCKKKPAPVVSSAPPKKTGSTWCITVSASKDNASLPFSSKASKSTQGGTKASTQEDSLLHLSTITFPAMLSGQRILTTDKLREDFNRRSGEKYDLQVIKLSVSYFPEDDDWKLDRIDVKLDFLNPFSEPEKEVLIVSHFPNTVFSDKNYSVDAHVGIGAGGKFSVKSSDAEAAKSSDAEAAKSFDAEAKANVGFDFTYKPLKATIISEGVGNHARWKLSSNKDEHPIGQKEYYVTVRIPCELESAKAEVKTTLFLGRKVNNKVDLPPCLIEIEFR